MQQHPVPQNVTGFQFKLIGDMTIKQFIFLAGGVLSAYFFSKTISMDLIKWPVVVGTFFLGFAFAFLPLEDRPLDLWVTNFFKAIYLPTMFLWKKSEDIPAPRSVTINVTSAMPIGARDRVPLKITSSIRSPRICLALCSPKTHRMASEILLFPHPLGPTIEVIPG